MNIIPTHAAPVSANPLNRSTDNHGDITQPNGFNHLLKTQVSRLLHDSLSQLKGKPNQAEEADGLSKFIAEAVDGLPVDKRAISELLQLATEQTDTDLNKQLEEKALTDADNDKASDPDALGALPFILNSLPETKQLQSGIAELAEKPTDDKALLSLLGQSKKSADSAKTATDKETLTALTRDRDTDLISVPKVTAERSKTAKTQDSDALQSANLSIKTVASTEIPDVAQPVQQQINVAPASMNIAVPSTTAAAPATPVFSMPPNVPISSPEWQRSLGQQLTMFSRNGIQNAELRLHPQDLGSLHIRLQLEDNQAQLQLISPHQHVRAILESALPHLRTALADSGINLNQTQINHDQSQQSNGQGFSSAQSDGTSSQRDGQRASVHAEHTTETGHITAESSDTTVNINAGVSVFV